MDGYCGSEVELVNRGGFPAPFAMPMDCDVSGYLPQVMSNHSVDDNLWLTNYQLIAGFQYHVCVLFPLWQCYVCDDVIPGHVKICKYDVFSVFPYTRLIPNRRLCLIYHKKDPKWSFFPYVWVNTALCAMQWPITIPTQKGNWITRGSYSLTLNVRGPSYLGLTRSISWLLMPWLLTSPGHQQPWYWLSRICKSWSHLRKDFKYLCQINVE